MLLEDRRVFLDLLETEKEYAVLRISGLESSASVVYAIRQQRSLLRGEALLGKEAVKPFPQIAVRPGDAIVWALVMKRRLERDGFSCDEQLLVGIGFDNAPIAAAEQNDVADFRI